MGRKIKSSSKSSGSAHGNRTSQQQGGTPIDTITDHKEILDLITPMLDDAQHVCHSRNTTKSMDIVKRMKTARDKCDRKTFPVILFRAYAPVFQSNQKSAFVDNLVDFIYVVCVAFEKEGEGTEEDENAGDTFGKVVLRCCAKHHIDKSDKVRLSITHLAVRLLKSFPSITTGEKKLEDKVKAMLLHRLKDKNAQVRVYGAMGLKYFQLGDNPTRCPVTKALMFHCEHDPNAEVRRNALNSLLLNEETKGCILGRVSDTNELVRVSALINITNKLTLDDLTLDQREKILKVGLTDCSDKVKERAGVLVEEWLKFCANDMVTFLSKLDVVDNTKICYLAFHQIFKEATTESFKKVNLTLWRDKLIPLEMLTEEMAFLWKYVVGKFRKIAICANLILPSTHDMCTYICHYFGVFEGKPDEEQSAVVLEHLIQILVFTSEDAEEGGRRELLDFIGFAFDFTCLGVRHVKVLMDLFYKVQLENVDEAFFELMENVMAKSKKPVVVEEGVDMDMEEEQEDTDDGEEDKSRDLSKSEMLNLHLELGNMVHEKHKAIREKDNALLNNDYKRAHEIQMRINDLADKADSLRRSLEQVQPPAATNVPSSERADTVSSQAGSQSQGNGAIETEDYVAASLAIGFRAFFEHIQSQTKVSNAARRFSDTFILTSIANFHTPVRVLVIQCLVLVGLRNPGDARRAMLLAIQGLAFDVDEVRVVAYRAIFDLLLQYGFEYFDDDGQIQRVAGDKRRSVNVNNSLLEEPAISLKFQVMDQLNSTNQELVKIGATGLVKLTLARRVSSEKIISRLLVMWSNPVYEDSQLAIDLSVWLPILAKLGEEQAFQIADSLVPTMRKLIYAGRQSPLADASPEKLVSFVANSTNVDSLGTSMKNPAAVHERMINGVLHEMSTLGPCVELGIFAKGLKFFSVRGLGAKPLESILKKVGRIMQSGVNKTVMQSLKAFHKYLNGELLLVADKQIAPDDPESHDDEVSTDSVESVHISEGSSPGEAENEGAMEEEEVAEDNNDDGQGEEAPGVAVTVAVGF